MLPPPQLPRDLPGCACFQANLALHEKRAMVWSMIFAGITTIITDVILLFTCGDYSSYSEEL